MRADTSSNILAWWQDWVCILLVNFLKGDAVQVCALVGIVRAAALELQQALAYASSDVLPHLQAPGAMQWLPMIKLPAMLCLKSNCTCCLSLRDRVPSQAEHSQRHQAHLSLVFAFTIAAGGQVTDVNWVAHSHCDEVSQTGHNSFAGHCIAGA